MVYNFDQIIERHHTDCEKYDTMCEHHIPEDVLPLWVADMDFSACPEVLSALNARIAHGVFGYPKVGSAYKKAVQHWFSSRFSWNTQENWVVQTPGVVYALCTAIRSFTNEGDHVLIQPPVYPPFANSVLKNNRNLSTNPLVLKNDRYTIDFVDFENKIIQDNVKLFILCSPHNPVGRVWTKEELFRMGEICLRHHVLIVSDEIHADFVYKGYHSIFASVDPRFAENCIVCTSPSKTFNLAGLQLSNIFIPNSKLRKQFVSELEKEGYCEPNVMALIACQAAYEYGEEWLTQLKQYLSDNIAFVRQFLQEQLPELQLIEPEGTYLLWLDFRKLNMKDSELDHFLTHDAKLWLNSGAIFGKEGSGFQRVNIACPRSILKQAFCQLEQAYRKYRPSQK